jgi:hypothetical protein
MILNNKMKPRLYSFTVSIYSIFIFLCICLYSPFVQAQQDIAVIKQNDKYGLIDNRGKVLLPCTYDELAVSCSDLILCKQGDKYGFIDRMGRTQIAFEYEEAGFFYNDTTWVKKEGKVGFIDRNGTLFIDCQYEKADFFSEGFAAVKYEGAWGLIDNRGNYLLSPIYDNVFPVKNDYAIVSKNNKQSLWSRENGFISPLWKYKYIDFLEGREDVFVATEIDGEHHEYLIKVIDRDMISLANIHYTSILNMPYVLTINDCYAEVYSYYTIFRDTAYQGGVLNPSFDRIISGYKEIKYLSPYYFLCMKKEGYYDPLEKHIYDTTGALVGDFSEYAEFGAYREGKLLVCKNEKWGMVDFQKNTLLPFKYEELTPFKNGVAMVRYKKKYYLIDERGKRISKALPCDALSWEFYEHLIVVRKDEKYGAIDYRGKTVLPLVHDNSITYYPMSFFGVAFK